MKLRFRRENQFLIVIFPDGSEMTRELASGEIFEDIMQKVRDSLKEIGEGILEEDSDSMTLGMIQ